LHVVGGPPAAPEAFEPEPALVVTGGGVVPAAPLTPLPAVITSRTKRTSDELMTHVAKLDPPGSVALAASISKSKICTGTETFTTWSTHDVVPGWMTGREVTE
jgi:hypothetical protein